MEFYHICKDINKVISGKEGDNYLIVEFTNEIDYETIEKRISSIKEIYKESKIGLYFNCFENESLYQKSSFYSPVNYRGINYIPKNSYHPVCPNYPEVRENFYSFLEKAQIIRPDVIYFDNLGYPFDWINDPLDVKDPMPRYCYCPYCLVGFSSVVGKIISNEEQMMDYMEEWLEWRITTISNLVSDIREYYGGKAIISLLPLFLIDIPFVTGQEIFGFLGKNFYLSTKFFIWDRKRIIGWYKNILEQINIEIPKEKFLFSVRITDIEKLWRMVPNIENYHGVVVFD
ncbi:MAG: hypothetical protein H0Z29_06535 [Candidatus Marinimicrobia bacterium]|nr:hypothetical protein [Candidatus Neomarinimicrobiota bacterium]